MKTKSNFYPVLILEMETVVGTARWGKTGRDNAKERAEEMARNVRRRGGRVFETKVVRAASRAEVMDLYAGKRFEKWGKVASRKN